MPKAAAALLAWLLVATAAAVPQPPVYRDASQPIDARVEDPLGRMTLEPGESRGVRFELGPEHLRMLDRDRQWVVESGRFRVTIGASSKDMRLRGELVVR
jgi:mannose-6-phosphate isomerase-like protein (cupin superfamily)